MAATKKVFDLVKTITDYWLANNAILFLVTEEPMRVWKAVKAATAKLASERKQKVNAWCHDKVCGFYQNDPGIRPPKDKSNQLLMGLQMMMEPQETMLSANADLKFPFNSTEDIIFMLKDPNWDLNEGPGKHSLVQVLRNAVQSNMASSNFHGDNQETKKPIRGKRMLILVSAVESLPEDMPEVDPMIVPLPNDDALGDALALMEESVVGQKVKGRELQALKPDERRLVVAAGRGLPTQKYSDALFLSFVEHEGWGTVGNFIQTINRRKAQMLEGIPGITFIQHEDIPFDSLPGYAEVEEFIDSRMALSEEEMAAHNISRLRGITLVGGPGLGKTLFAMLISKRVQKNLVLISPGEAQQGIVGASQKNWRRILNAVDAIGAVALVDDIDKAGMNVTQSGYSGDGGVSGQMVQMLLTEMSMPTSKVIWVFTANRIQMVPGELIRAGRMDERFFVEYPDVQTRLNILQLHIRDRKMTVDDTDALQDLASQHTDGWAGSELSDLVKDASIWALAHGSTKINTIQMIAKAKAFTPMSKQKAFAADIAAMQEAASQFRKVGRIKTESKTSARGKAARTVNIGG